MADSKKEEETVDLTHVGETMQAEGGLEEFFENHLKKILLGGVVIAVGAGAWIFMKEASKVKEASAAEAFTSALTQSDLETVLNEHKGTNAAGNALLMIAERLLTTGKAEDAKIRLNEFLSNYQDHPRRSQAEFALAGIAEETGDTATARQQFQAVVDGGGDLGALAMIRLANLDVADGELESAEATLNGVMQRFVGNPFINLLDSRRQDVRRMIAQTENPAPEFEWPDPPAVEEGKTEETPSLPPTIPVPPASLPEGTASTSAIEIPAFSDLDDNANAEMPANEVDTEPDTAPEPESP
ncbi:MAG: tetratricopeptide repeat protein [Verrucomicrobiota bacterium]